MTDYDRILQTITDYYRSTTDPLQAYHKPTTDLLQAIADLLYIIHYYRLSQIYKLLQATDYCRP